MGTITRPGKVAGGTSVTTDTNIEASDWNGDVDTIYNEFNGQIDDDNIKSSAGIDPAKIDDYSVSAAESVTIVSPGTTDTPLKATDLTGEIARLRYNDVYAGLGISAQYYDGSANATIGPWDGVRVGHNLVQNGSLQLSSAGTPNAPDGWSLSNTPTSVSLLTVGADIDSAQVCAIVGSGTADGITQTIKGLKDSTLYIIGCRARAANNAATMTVSGGLATGAFKNTNRSIAVHASTYTTYSLAVKSTASGGNITITFATGSTAADALYIHDVFMYEVAKDPKSLSTNTVYKKSLSSSTTISGALSNAWVSGPSGLNISVFAHKANQRVIFHASLSVYQGVSAGPVGAIRLKRDGTVVAGPYPVTEDAAGYMQITDVVDNPTPGAAIDYTFEVWDDSGGFTDYVFSDSIAGLSSPVQSTSDVYCRVEDIH